MKKALVFTLALFLISTLAYAVTYELVDPNSAKTYDAQVTATETKQVQTIDMISVNSINAEIARIDNVISGINSQLSALQARKAALIVERDAIIAQFKLTDAVAVEPIL